MPTASASTSAPNSHHNQEGAPSVSVEVGATDVEVVGDGAAAGADCVAVEVSVRVTVRCVSGWVGADVSSRSDDLVSSGSV
jgi:hypothetical protein